MERDLTMTKYGSFLVIPLKFQEEPSEQCLEKLFDVHRVSTPDLNPNVKALFHNESTPNVGKCYHLRKDRLYEYLNVADEIFFERYACKFLGDSCSFFSSLTAHLSCWIITVTIWHYFPSALTPWRK